MAQIEKHKTKPLDFLTKPIGGLSKEKEAYIETFSMLLNSGLDIKQALKASKKNVKNKWLLKEVEFIEENVSSGYSLWESVSETSLLPQYMISLIRIGEKSGKLPENLEIIVDQQRKTRSLKGKLVTALIYPGIVFVLTLIIGIAVFVFVIPRLSTVYAALNVDLPVVTRIILRTADFLKQYGIIVIPVATLIFVTVYSFLFIRKNSRKYGQKIIFFFKASRNIVVNVEVTRFGFLLSTLIEAGVPILEAIKSIREATDFYHYQKFYEYLEKGIGEGLTFQNIFGEYKTSDKLFPLTVQQIITSAEKSGKLAHSLKRIAGIYEEKIDNASKNLAVIIEPVLLIIVWLGVVIVALSVILPVYSLINNVTNETRNNSNTQNSNP